MQACSSRPRLNRGRNPVQARTYRRSMPAMLPHALQLPLIEARIRLVRATPASCSSRFPLHRLPLIRERLLRLGAHRRPLKGFRRLAGAPLGSSSWAALCFSGLVAEERNFAHLATTNRRISPHRTAPRRRRRGDAVPSVLDARQPDPELAVVIYGQGGRHADLHGWFSLYVDDHAEKGQPRRQVY